MQFYAPWLCTLVYAQLVVAISGGKKSGVRLMTVFEVADGFFNIENVMRDDLLAAHRTQPQLHSIFIEQFKRARRTGRGAPGAAASVFGRNEIRPLPTRFAELNVWLGEEVVTFDDYEISPAPVTQ